MEDWRTVYYAVLYTCIGIMVSSLLSTPTTASSFRGPVSFVTPAEANIGSMYIQSSRVCSRILWVSKNYGMVYLRSGLFTSLSGYHRLDRHLATQSITSCGARRSSRVNWNVAYVDGKGG
jgi:hypothetical protein